MRMIGQRAILGGGDDFDFMMKSYNVTETAREVAARVPGCIVETMFGPYKVGGGFRRRFRITFDNIDIIIVESDEYDYVDECYKEARRQKDLYRKLRYEVGKIEAYNHFGIALVPRNWVKITL